MRQQVGVISRLEVLPNHEDANADIFRRSTEDLVEARVFEQLRKKHDRRRLLGSGENDFWQADPDREVIQDRGRSRGAVPDPGKMRRRVRRRVGINRLQDVRDVSAPIPRRRMICRFFTVHEAKKRAWRDASRR